MGLRSSCVLEDERKKEASPRRRVASKMEVVGWKEISLERVL